MSNLNVLDNSLKDKLILKAALADKLLNKKLERSSYQDQDGKLQKTIDQLKDQISEVTDNLTL